MVDSVALAQHVADDVLFPHALETDAAPLVPVDLLDQLAASGFYGLTAAADLGGWEATPQLRGDVMEALATGCMTTTFVWMQHAFAMGTVSAAPGPVRDAYGELFCRGEKRSGSAFGHLRRPDPPLVRATETEGGWIVDGLAPLVTGWGVIDFVLVGARMGEKIVWLLADAETSPTLRVQRLDLAAVNASATVVMTLERHFVPSARVVLLQSFAEWQERDQRNQRTSSSLALGITRRACALLGPSPFDDELCDVRAQLDRAALDEVPLARAAASVLATRATAALVAAGGGKSVVRDAHAQRLAREAIFLLVQGQTAAMREEQHALFARVPAPR